MIRRLVFLHLMGLSGGVALASDGFSGSIDAELTDPKGQGPYQRVMTPKVKVRPDSICRFSVEANAFARLLGGATFVAKPSVRRGVNAFLFRDRHGRDVVLAWEREAGRPCEIVLPDGVTAFDLYGNPIKSRIFALGTEPVYFFGEGLLETFK